MSVPASASGQSIAFDRAAGFYDQTRGFPPGEEQRIAALLAEAGHLTCTSRVLEIGVGTGRIALPLAAHVDRVVGLDLARAMMERLRAKRRAEPITLIQGDLTRLPLATGAFDAVVAVHIFHLVPGWRAALDEAARVLAPGGALLIGHSGYERVPDEELLREAWQSAVPRERTAPVGVPRERLDDFPEAEGWQRTGEALVHRYRVTRTLRRFLDHIERRTHSSSWRLTDDEIARGLAAALAAAGAHRLALDAPFEQEQRFEVRAYRPPAPGAASVP